MNIVEHLSVGARRYSISRATEDEVAGLVALLADDLLGTTREHADLEAYLTAFREIDADRNQYLAVVRDADADGAICGTFQLTLIPCLARGGSKRLQIEAVRLSRSARGNGLGTAMFAWAHEWGRRHGARLAQLTTDRQRDDARRFYDALGYNASHEGYKLAL